MARNTRIDGYYVDDSGKWIPDSTTNENNLQKNSSTNANNTKNSTSNGGSGGMLAANTQGVTKKWLDVPYASKSKAEKMDIYLPNTGEGSFPVIVAIHGGGFFSGDKTQEKLMTN